MKTSTHKTNSYRSGVREAPSLLLAGSVAVLSAAHMSCGLLAPSDDSHQSGRRDIASGFVGGSGVEVCFDGKRIVSSSQAKGGPLSMCIGAGEEPRACLSSSTCETGESCVCGRCTTRPCRTSTDCAGGEVCQGSRCVGICSDDSDCLAGQKCSAGGCATPCTTAADCSFGQRCSSFDGTCVVKLCGDAVVCGAADVCVPQQRVADLHEPHPMVFGGRRVVYLEARGDIAWPNNCVIIRARVVTPTRWVVDPPSPVLVPAGDDNACLMGPSAIKQDDRVVLYVARGDGTAIVRASSQDGVSFTRDERVVLSPSEDGSIAAEWERGWIGSPGVVALEDGSTLMLYEGGRGSGIGLARVDAPGNTGSARRLMDRPCLTPLSFENGTFWRDIEKVRSPFPIVINKSLFVYLTVRGVEGSDASTKTNDIYPADINDSIGMAVLHGYASEMLADMLSVDTFPTGPLFARRTNMRAYLGESEPAVHVETGVSWLVYSSTDASGDQRMGIGLATAR